MLNPPISVPIEKGTPNARKVNIKIIIKITLLSKPNIAGQIKLVGFLRKRNNPSDAS